jgi:hypothetical protein
MFRELGALNCQLRNLRGNSLNQHDLRFRCLQAGAQLLSQSPAPGARAAASDGNYLSILGKLSAQKSREDFAKFQSKNAI